MAPNSTGILIDIYQASWIGAIINDDLGPELQIQCFPAHFCYERMTRLTVATNMAM